VRGLKHSVLSCREWLYQRCQRRKKSQRTAARQQFAIRAHERECCCRDSSAAAQSRRWRGQETAACEPSRATCQFKHKSILPKMPTSRVQNECDSGVVADLTLHRVRSTKLWPRDYDKFAVIRSENCWNRTLQVTESMLISRAISAIRDASSFSN